MKLADLLAQKANATDETLTDLTQAQHLLSTLTPSLKTSALAALSKTAQHDEKTPALSDEDLAQSERLIRHAARTTCRDACRRRNAG
ncbi:flagellar hook-length control protein [Salmonella enterica subsp. enterica serovar Typhimurium]|nr:flagellar hook-length control protein [Salmonella enterica subsp. enterica serovar Typhimurium]